VCSAGYGLISLTSRLLPYSATFSEGQVDSVCAGRTGDTTANLSTWWQTVASWEGPDPVGPRSLAELARRFPRRPLLLAVSANYLKALQRDVLEANGHLARSELLSILSTGADNNGNCGQHLLPCDARLQTLVGGARSSLNVRLAAKVLQEVSVADLKLPALSQQFEEWLTSCPPVAIIRRTPMSDEDVRNYVRVALEVEPNLRPTPLLRRLRDQGLACEHHRFVKLFMQLRKARYVH
jgi:hypothetical protein